jgi:hypothetical protein
MFRLRGPSNPDPELAFSIDNPPLNPQRITQVTVAALIERAEKTNPRLNRYDFPLPRQLISHGTLPLARAFVIGTTN